MWPAAVQVVWFGYIARESNDKSESDPSFPSPNVNYTLPVTALASNGGVGRPQTLDN